MKLTSTIRKTVTPETGLNRVTRATAEGQTIAKAITVGSAYLGKNTPVNSLAKIVVSAGRANSIDTKTVSYECKGYFASCFAECSGHKPKNTASIVAITTGHVHSEKKAE